MYTEGSNALKTEYTAYDAPKRTVGAVKMGNAAAAKRINVRMMKKRAVCAVLVLFAMAFTVLFRYAAIAKEFDELSKARSELELVNAKVVEKQMAAEGNLDPKRIEQEAERLGLRQPVKSQIKYISLGNTDNGEVIKAEEASALSAFINRISVILEYLY